MRTRLLCKFVKDLDTRDGSKNGKDWVAKNVLVKTVDDNQDLCITLFGDKKISDFGTIKEGTELELDVIFRSNESNGRYFTNCNFEEIVSQDDKYASNSEELPMEEDTDDLSSSNDKDDLPF